MKLTEAQRKYLVDLFRGKADKRKMGAIQARLAEMGLIKMYPPFGWIITEKGASYPLFEDVGGRKIKWPSENQTDAHTKGDL